MNQDFNADHYRTGNRERQVVRFNPSVRTAIKVERQGFSVGLLGGVPENDLKLMLLEGPESLIPCTHYLSRVSKFIDATVTALAFLSQKISTGTTLRRQIREEQYFNSTEYKDFHKQLREQALQQRNRATAMRARAKGMRMRAEEFRTSLHAAQKLR